MIDRIVERIAGGGRVTVLTGAGLSAASGVPTFRGAGGLWNGYRAEDLATPAAFARSPLLVWKWYDWRRQLIARCQPNRAHDVIADWSRRYPNFSLITQNVDGLHEQAGTARVLRFHGSIWEVLCWNQCGGEPARWQNTTVPLPELPPRCPHCAGPVRPGVVWFGEPIDPLTTRQSTLKTACDVFVTAGTSALVYPAAGLLEQAASLGALTVEINTDSTPATSSVDLVLRAPAVEIFDAIERRLAGIR